MSNVLSDLDEIWPHFPMKQYKVVKYFKNWTEQFLALIKCVILSVLFKENVPFLFHHWVLEALRIKYDEGDSFGELKQIKHGVLVWMKQNCSETLIDSS